MRSSKNCPSKSLTRISRLPVTKIVGLTNGLPIGLKLLVSLLIGFSCRKQRTALLDGSRNVGKSRRRISRKEDFDTCASDMQLNPANEIEPVGGRSVTVPRSREQADNIESQVSCYRSWACERNCLVIVMHSSLKEKNARRS